jgi:hypothetical protein
LNDFGDRSGSTKLLRLPCETRFAGSVTLMLDVLDAYDALELMLVSEDMKYKRDCDDTFFVVYTVSKHLFISRIPNVHLG